MKVSVGISNRHVHLTDEDYKILFGNIEMEKRNDLKQPGMFACTQTVSLKTPKRTIDNVRILGPFRDYTQVEISKTDSYMLGINPPVRNSGDLIGAEEIEIIGPMGSIVRKAAIIATRHIHVNQQIREEKGLVGVDKVNLRINGEKGGTIENVYLKDSTEAYFELHLDTDDANAHGIKNGNIGVII